MNKTRPLSLVWEPEYSIDLYVKKEYKIDHITARKLVPLESVLPAYLRRSSNTVIKALIELDALAVRATIQHKIMGTSTHYQITWDSSFPCDISVISSSTFGKIITKGKLYTDLAIEKDVQYEGYYSPHIPCFASFAIPWGYSLLRSNLREEIIEGKFSAATVEEAKTAVMMHWMANAF